MKPKIKKTSKSKTTKKLPSAIAVPPNPVQADRIFHDYYLEYAAYVILDRAIPSLADGLKPVQRRILHALDEMDDGRYNKVANVVGHTMRYHPHGDASIFEAMVNLAQKNLLIDTQGNWGNLHTGDSAAAPRYIEARLTPFAKEILYNEKLTVWRPSYDGRSREPINLPVKFPLVLSSGSEGIAVGLSNKILPHNDGELCKAAIAFLQGKSFKLFPDFPSGAAADCSGYNDGMAGGRVRVRAKTEVIGDALLRIAELPYGLTTGGLIESILAAVQKDKIKIKKIEDNTAKSVDILLHLPPGEDPGRTIDALYAFTRCEESIATSACLIEAGVPRFLGVSDILRQSVRQTVELLRLELLSKKEALSLKIHLSSLEKIFIEKRIYRHIEQAESWEQLLSIIDTKLAAYKALFHREITSEDLITLTEIKIKRISKFDIKKADEKIKSLSSELAAVDKKLANLNAHAIDHYAGLLTRYGSQWERKTKLGPFTDVDKTKLRVANLRLYVNRKDGFVGTGLKKEEFIFECSQEDELICMTADGLMKIIRPQEKTFVGKNIIHLARYSRGDLNTIYTMIYVNRASDRTMVKRFAVPSITRDKVYDLTRGNGESKVLFIHVAPASDAAPIRVIVTHKAKPRIKKEVKVDLQKVLVKDRDAKGNILSPHAAARVTRDKG